MSLILQANSLSLGKKKGWHKGKYLKDCKMKSGEMQLYDEKEIKVGEKSKIC